MSQINIYILRYKYILEPVYIKQPIKYKYFIAKGKHVVRHLSMDATWQPVLIYGIDSTRKTGVTS